MSRITVQQRQSGFNLVEVMVALTIGLLLLAGLVSLVVNTSQNFDEADKSSQQMESGRFALDLISFDLQHAGFYGDLSSPQTLGLPGAMPLACSLLLADIEAALPLAVQGEDAPVVSTLNCINNHKAGTDTLVIRRTAATQTENVNNLAVGQLYLQTLPIPPPTGGMPYILATASGGAGDAATFTLTRQVTTTNPVPSLGDIRKLRTDIYFVSRCSSAACTDTLPTLMRTEIQVSGGNLGWNTVPLVEGVEDMQIDYGIDTNGDSIVDNFVTDPGTVLGWSQVMTARIHLLIRNTELTAGYNDQKSYNMGLAGIVAPDPNATNYRRHVYSTTVRLENPAARLE